MTPRAGGAGRRPARPRAGPRPPRASRRPGSAGPGRRDRAALSLANRLVANDEGAAAIEVLLGGLAVRAPRCSPSPWPAPRPRRRSTARRSATTPSSTCGPDRCCASAHRRPGCAPTSPSAAASTSRRCSARAARTPCPASARPRCGPATCCRSARSRPPCRSSTSLRCAPPPGDTVVLRAVLGPRADFVTDPADADAHRLDGVEPQRPDRHAAGGREAAAGRRRASCPARGWSGARSRCRRAASRSCSSPTTR